MSKIPFDIKLKPQIESGEYKVETGTGKKVRIICWDKKSDTNKKKIVALLDDGNSEHTEYYTEKGTVYDKAPAGGDLFIITQEEEMTPFEKGFLERVFHQKAEDLDEENREIFREDARYVLGLAREQFIKDGYVIEKKAFHDAVEKVAPEVMKAVLENVDNANEELTEFEKGCIRLYQDGRDDGFAGDNLSDENLKECSAELLALARKELIKEGTSKNEMGTMLYDAGFEDGKAEALKDLPRWRKWENGACGNGQGIPLAIVKRGLNGYKIVDALGIQGEQYLMLSELEKLPGFKED